MIDRKGHNVNLFRVTMHLTKFGDHFLNLVISVVSRQSWVVPDKKIIILVKVHRGHLHWNPMLRKPILGDVLKHSTSEPSSKFSHLSRFVSMRKHTFDRIKKVDKLNKLLHITLQAIEQRTLRLTAFRSHLGQMYTEGEDI